MTRLLVFLAVCSCALAGQPVNSAPKALGQRVAAELMADEAAAVTWREPIPQYVKTAFLTGLRPRPRNPKMVEIRVTLSENIRGPLLIAEIVRDSGNVVEMIDVPREADGKSRFPLKISMVWEQEPQILDLQFQNDEMLVLDTSGLTTYRRQDGQWHSVATQSLSVPPVRDPRGRIDMTKNPVIAYVPGGTCSNGQCESGGIFTEGRNTLSEEGWPPHYTRVETTGLEILAETEGRIHLYDANKMPLGIFVGWGSDFAVISSNCSGEKILAAEASTDGVALYEIANGRPLQASDMVALPGPITAIWPQGSAAVVIARDSKTGRYEAYSASVDCHN